MSKYRVKGNGPLTGEVEISGSKNAVLPLMAASLLTNEKCVIKDTPALRDVDVMCQIIEAVGGRVHFDRNTHILEMETNLEKGVNIDVSSELAGKMRASVLIIGPLLARTGKVTIALPGGCSIGARPIDLHLKGFKAMGAKIYENGENGHDYVIAESDGLTGCDIYLDFPSVGATQNLMMAAVLAKGSTQIQNAAKEPEITDLANFLNRMGATVRGAGTDTIRITGVEHLKGVEYNVIADRIEAGTFMVAAAITRGCLQVNNVVEDHLEPVVAKLRECGVQVRKPEAKEGEEAREDALVVDARGAHLVATKIKTMPCPGFPTDMQAQFMALLATVEGVSIINETVFENRFMHVDELKKMGANIKQEDRMAIIVGNKQLQGAVVQATDLRAGAALVLAGLAAKGTTEIEQAYFIERGYEGMVDKLRNVGAHIEEV